LEAKTNNKFWGSNQLELVRVYRLNKCKILDIPESPDLKYGFGIEEVGLELAIFHTETLEDKELFVKQFTKLIEEAKTMRQSKIATTILIDTKKDSIFRALSPQRRVISPQKSRTLSPQKSRGSSPQKSRALSPQKMRTLSPQKSRALSPQKARTFSPQKMRTLSPQKSRASSPPKIQRTSKERVVSNTKAEKGKEKDKNKKDQFKSPSADQATLNGKDTTKRKT